jgi:hypothetical protein
MTRPSIDTAGELLRPPAGLGPASMRYAKVLTVDLVNAACTVALSGDSDNPAAAGIAGGYHPQVDDQAVLLQNDSDLLAIDRLIPASPDLAHEVNYQQWTSTSSPALTTSFILFTSSTTCDITKRYANTRIKGHVDLSFNNPDGVDRVYEFALYATGGSGGDATGQWPIVRLASDGGGPRYTASGTRMLGAAGRYPTGALSFAVAVRVTSGTALISAVGNQHTFSIEIQEVW